MVLKPVEKVFDGRISGSDKSTPRGDRGAHRRGARAKCHDIGTVLQQVKSIACVNETLHYHPDTGITGEWLEQNFNCPIELLGHGNLPHRILKEHRHE